MRYFVATDFTSIPANDGPIGILIHNAGWNDWYKYRTLFSLSVKVGPTIEPIGSVKIGRKGMTPEQGTPDIAPVFEQLDDNFFSVGANEDYYENAIRFFEAHGVNVLKDFRDCAENLALFDANYHEDVMGESLLRSIAVSQVRGRFHRLATGNATLTEFAFAHILPNKPDLASAEDNTGEDGAVSFIVEPKSKPPTNIHVLIGRNGVGKTTRLTGIVQSLLNLPMPGGTPPGRVVFYKDDEWTGEQQQTEVPDFANLVSVAFSAFDPFIPPTKAQLATTKLGYSYIGLKRPVSSGPEGQLPETYSREELARQFANSAFLCRAGLRAERWASALAILEADPLFEEANVRSLLDDVDASDWRERATAFFTRLSSGHGIVLLTITRLVELVDERTLVLLDEPEGHLHPPLLSAFVRALSALLAKRNAVAIIATHSPVVLQEVPASCVWYMSRSGSDTWAERPPRETFAENVGVLTRDVFGLEVAKSGFHQMIAEVVNEQRGDFDAVLQTFNNALGEEGAALARALSIRKAKTSQGAQS